jgi:hypothetical protein
LFTPPFYAAIAVTFCRQRYTAAYAYASNAYRHFFAIFFFTDDAGRFHALAFSRHYLCSHAAFHIGYLRFRQIAFFHIIAIFSRHFQPDFAEYAFYISFA